MKTLNFRLLLLMLASVLLSKYLAAQTCDGWYFDAQSSGNGQISTIYEGDSGMVVMGGYFTGTSLTATLANDVNTPLQDQITASSSSNIVLTVTLKEGVAGSDIRWNKAFPVTNSQSLIDDVAYKNGAVYVSGYFRGSMDLGTTTLISGGALDAFLIKIGSTGDIVWAKQGTGPGWERMRRMVIDDNNVYVAGYYQNGANFDGTSLTALFDTESFVASYEQSNGSLNWITAIMGSNGKDDISGIDIDPSGNLYFTGTSFGGITFNSNTINGNGSRQAIIGKMDNAGDIDWLQLLGGSGTEGGQTITYDPVNDVVVVGGNTASTNFDPLGTVLPSYGGQDVMVVAFEPIAGAIQWAITGGSANDDDIEGADYLGNGRFVFGGRAEGSFTFNGVSAPIGSTSRSILYAQVDANGDVLELELFGGSGTDAAVDIAVAKVSGTNGVNVSLAGYYQNNMTLGNYNYSAASGSNGFVWSFCAASSSSNTTCDEQMFQAKGNGNVQTTASFEADMNVSVIGGYFTGSSAVIELTNTQTSPLQDQVNLQNTNTNMALYVAVKSSSPGSELLFAKAFPLSSSQGLVDGVLYKNGATYVTGYFNGTLDLGTQTLVSSSVDAFLLKLDSNGDVVWAKQPTGSGWERMRRLVADDNNVYVVGYYQNGANFDGNILTALFDTEGFVASYTASSGSLNWVTPIKGDQGKEDLSGITIDGQGNIYFCGGTYGNVTYNSTTLSGFGNRDVLFGKLNNQGDVVWMDIIGGSAADAGQTITYNPTDGLIYMTGPVNSNDFAPMGSVLPSYGGQDFFVSAHDLNGNAQWVKAGGSSGDDDLESAGYFVDGGIVTCGRAEGSVQYDGSSITGSAGSRSALYLQIDENGTMLDASLSGGTGTDGAIDITIRNNAGSSVVTIAGYYQSSIVLNGVTYTSTGGFDGFAWRFCIPNNSSQNPGTSDVWPGDADNNGIANNWDILPIGLIYGDQGPVRTGASSVWVGQPATDWGTQFINGTDYKHVDCDGNGQVDLLDIVPIILNYGQSHPKREQEQRLVGPALFVDLIEDSVLAGDTAEFNIELGIPSSLAQNIYGLAFTINFDPELVVQGSVTSSYANSWLGNLGTNMEKLDIELHQQGKFDVGVTRVDKAAMTGAGEILRVSVITIDNISGKDLMDLIMPIWISDVKVIDNNGIEVPVETSPDTLTILGVEVGINNIEDDLLDVYMYPNPAKHMLTVGSTEVIEKIEIYNMLGQLVLEMKSLGAEQHQFNISKLDQGMHYIEIYSRDRSVRKHLMILR